MTNRLKGFLTVCFAGALLTALFILNSHDSKSSPEGPDMTKAKKLYADQCSKCHRKTGKGIVRVYPPLKDADYIKKAGTVELLRGMIFGRSGTIKVNGVTYNGVMTTEIDKSLSDEDIALILTYIYKELNGMNTIVSAKDVKAAKRAGKLPPHND